MVKSGHPLHFQKHAENQDYWCELLIGNFLDKSALIVISNLWVDQVKYSYSKLTGIATFDCYGGTRPGILVPGPVPLDVGKWEN